MMRAYWATTVGIVALTSISEPAAACFMRADLKLEDVKYADEVVIGRIKNYRIVRDKKELERILTNPSLTPGERRNYKSSGILSDYAHFEVVVDRVLFGKPLRRMSVTWDNSTFDEPKKMSAGPFLIALRLPTSKRPPLRGPSATILPNREPGALTVLQAPCSRPFIFKADSEEAKELQSMLTGHLTKTRVLAAGFEWLKSFTQFGWFSNLLR